MVRRAFWLSTGMAVGAASSISVMRRVRRQVQRFTPSARVADLGQTVGALGGQLRAAVDEGREAMREREAQLWAELDPDRPLRSGVAQRSAVRRRPVST